MSKVPTPGLTRASKSPLSTGGLDNANRLYEETASVQKVTCPETRGGKGARIAHGSEVKACGNKALGAGREPPCKRNLPIAQEKTYPVPA